MNDRICNLCGLSCMIGPKNSPARRNAGLIDVDVVGGYESTPGNGCGALDDTTHYRFNLCEFCLDWLFERFTIPVDSGACRFKEFDGEKCVYEKSEKWRSAAQRVLEDDWRKEKKEFFAEKAKRDAARTKRGMPN